MVDPPATALLQRASEVERRARHAARWFPRYLLALGVLAFGLIVAVEAVTPSTGARLAASAVWAVAVGLLGWWADRQAVQPRGATRRLVVANVAWFASYLVVLGPVVRWRAGDSLGWWALAAAVMASPFAVAAWRASRHP